MYRGDTAKADARIDSLFAFAPNTLRLGRPEEARRLAEYAARPFSVSRTAEQAAASGEPDAALAALERWRADGGRDCWLEYSPFFRELRQRPRFRALVADMRAELDSLRAEGRRAGLVR